MFDNYKKQYEQIWKMFIRPYRQKYYIYDLGHKIRTYNQKIIKRHDIDLKNDRNLTLKCSYFEIFDTKLDSERSELPLNDSSKPCLIYLHCNAASRLEALELLPYFVEVNMNLFCFDFSGCGLSEGEYISLGVYEAQDLKCVVEFLRKDLNIKHIGLWGRSMGAVTALRYASTDSRISCLFCDSPFSDLKKLALDFAKDHSKVPAFLVKGALTFVKRSIKKRANFNIKDLDQTVIVKKCVAPIIFVTSEEDNFVKPWHVEKLFQLYGGEKKLKYVKGDHNAPRNKEFYREGAEFFRQNLQNKHLFVHVDNSILPKEEEKSNNHLKIPNIKGKIRLSSSEAKKKAQNKSNNSQEDSSDDSSGVERRKSSENINKKQNLIEINNYKYHQGKEKIVDPVLYKNPFREMNHITLTKK